MKLLTPEQIGLAHISVKVSLGGKVTHEVIKEVSNTMILIGQIEVYSSVIGGINGSFES